MDSQYTSGSASLFSALARQPEMAYAIRPLNREVVIVKFGEEGFYRTDYGVQSREWVKEQNEKLGVDEATAGAMALCSMFHNWDNFENIRDAMKKQVNHAD